MKERSARDGEIGKDGVVGVCSMARGGRRQVGVVRREFSSSEQAPASRKCEDGDNSGICNGYVGG